MIEFVRSITLEVNAWHLGVVREGKIVPQRPLPDGLQVQISFPDQDLIPEELQAELDEWAMGSAEALALVERLAAEDADHEEG
jgi:hypothetical protein